MMSKTGVPMCDGVLLTEPEFLIVVQGLAFCVNASGEPRQDRSA
jgi:hypothetical protein